MTAHRMVWLSCDGSYDGQPCDASTMGDLYVEGATPATVTEARAAFSARGWRRRPDGRFICPDCWASGQR